VDSTAAGGELAGRSVVKDFRCWLASGGRIVRPVCLPICLPRVPCHWPAANFRPFPCFPVFFRRRRTSP